MTSEFSNTPSPAAPEAPYPVRLEVEYPQRLSRGLIFVKWLLVIPHLFIIAFLSWGSLVAMFLAWWAILFTGRYPRSLFDFNVEVQQWSARVNAYGSLLVTDRYPPFSLGRSSVGIAVLMVAIGALGFAGFMVAYVLIVLSIINS